MMTRKYLGALTLAAALAAFPVLAQNMASQDEIPDARWAEHSRKITALQDRLQVKDLEYEALVRSGTIDRKEITALAEGIVELRGQIRDELKKLYPLRDVRWASVWHDGRAPGMRGCPTFPLHKDPRTISR